MSLTSAARHGQRDQDSDVPLAEPARVAQGGWQVFAAAAVRLC
jgi:hypothetical protein